MGFLRAPSPPNPAKTAQAQLGYNTQSAQTQARLAMTGQSTPTGTLSWQADPSSPSGYRAASSYSPEVQGVYGNVTHALAQPLDLSENATEGRLMDLGRARLDPIFNQREQALETDLMNRGIRPGSDAYAAAHDALGRERTDAYDQLLLQGHQQGVSDILAERERPLQEFTSLVGGGNPQFGATPSPGVAPVDYTGLTSQEYQAQAAQHAAMLGGLAGAAGSALGGWAFGGFPGATRLIGGLGGGTPQLAGTH